MHPTVQHTITLLMRRSEQYLVSLRLSPVSRKLYLADIRNFLNYFAKLHDLTPSSLAHPLHFREYLDHLLNQGSSPAAVRRTFSAMRQFGKLVSEMYNLPDPTLSLGFSQHSSTGQAKSLTDNYIKNYLNYLTTLHLSPTTLKSYKSDVLQYLQWCENSVTGIHEHQVLTSKNAEKYLIYLAKLANCSLATLDRKKASLTKFHTWLTSAYPHPIIPDSKLTPSTSQSSTTPYNPVLTDSITPSPLAQASALNLLRLPARLSTFLLLILLIGMAVFGYRQFSRDRVLLTQAYPSSPVTPNRQISFQGRLENAGGTPITSATNFVFKLYDAVGTGTPPSGGSELYSSGTCSITPDGDGVFSTQIGSDCGSAITSSIFTENANVWLQVTVGAETLSPRQQIATVAYALNSETLQGFPLSATVAAIRNTVVPMNQYGEIIVGEQSPRLTGVAGTFQISAPSLSFTTASGTNGNISIAPDGTGQVNLTGNTTSTNFFNVSNAQVTTGSLITGTVANANTGYKLLDLLSGSSPTSKFSVTDTGLTTVGADLYVTSGISLYNNTVTDDTVEAGKFCTGDGETNCVTDFSTLSSGASIWTDGGAYIYPTSAEVLGNSASAGANKIAGLYLADSAPAVFGTDNDVTFTFAGTELGVTQGNNDINFDSNTLIVDGSDNRVGIGTAPSTSLHVNSGASAGNPEIRIGADNAADTGALEFANVHAKIFRTSNWMQYDGYEGHIFASTQNTNHEMMRITQVGDVGIGTTGPDARLDSLATTGEQLRLTYTDGSVYSGFTVDSSGNLNINNSGTKTVIADDLQITGDDLIMGTNTTGHLLVADGTNYNPVAMSGDITINSSGVTAIGSDKILESMLKSVNAATDEYCLTKEDTTGDFEWQTCGSGGGGSNWRISQGAISPVNDTLDLLVGSTATSSASFAVLNVDPNAAGVPTASVSAQTNGAAFLTADGHLSTTQRQSLTLGNSSTYNTTGNILLHPNGTGNVGIGDNTPDYTVDIEQTLTNQNDQRSLNLNPTYSYTSNGSYANYGLYSNVISTGTANNTNLIEAVTASVSNINTGTIAEVIAGDFYVSNSNGGTITAATGLITGVGNSSGTIVTGYGIYINDIGATNDYGVYQTGSDDVNYLAGSTGIGTAGPDAKLDSLATSGEQLRLTYTDGSVYTGFTVDSNGDLSIDATGGDVTLAGGDNLNLTASTDLFFGTTSLGEATVANDSGAFVVGVFDEFDYSTASTVQGVLNDLDIQLAALTAGTSGIWTDAGAYLHPTAGEVLGNSASAGANKIAGIYLADSAPLVFGADNDFTFSFNNSASTLGSTLTAGTRFGINTTSAHATLDIRSSLGTIPVASISGNTSMAALIVDQSGSGDIFTASSSGNTRFVVKENGNVGIGVSNPTSKLQVGGSSSTISNDSGNITIDAAGGSIVFGTDDDLIPTLSAGSADLGSASAPWDNLYTNAAYFAGGTTYYVDSAGNAKFLDLIVGDTGNPGLTVGNGSIGYAKIGGSTISDNAGNLTLDSDSAALTLAADDTTLTATGLATLDTAASVTWDATTLTLGANATINGGSAANDDLVLQGTSNATRTTSYVNLQPNGGNVGIGTSTPTDLLSLEFTGTVKTTNIGMSITNLANAADMNDTITGIEFNQYYYHASTPNIDQSGAVIVGTETDWTSTAGTRDSYMRFQTAQDGVLNDRMTITSAGLVGIGTTGPGTMLEVAANDATNNDITNLLTLTHTTTGTATSASTNFTVDQANSLGNRLESYYKLEEASGTRIDSAATDNLSDGNTVTSTTGKVGNAAVFTRANNEYLGGLDTTKSGVNDGTGYTVAGWFYLASKPAAAMALATKYFNGTNRDFYLWWRNTDDRIVYQVYDSAGTVCGTVTASTFGAPSLSTWYYVAAWYDPNTRNIHLQVNNGAVENGNSICEPGNSPAQFILGQDQGVAATTALDGRLDEWGIWKRVLTTQEKTDLYNGGSGNTCTDDCNDPSTTTTGIGAGILLRAEDAAGNTEDQARIASIFNTAANGTETSSLLFQTRSGGGALARTMRLDGPGNLTLAGNLMSSGNPDIAENIRVTDPSIEAGDIVAVDLNYQAPEGSNIYNQTAAMKADLPYSSRQLGVISTDPGILLNASDNTLESGLGSEGNERPLVLAGRVPVKVSSENGPILPGDSLTASSIPGVGMKAVRNGYVVGKALESFSCGDPISICTGQVLALVSPSWHEPDVTLNPYGELALRSTGELVQPFAIVDEAGNIAQNVGAFAKAVVADLSAGLTRTLSLQTDLISPIASDSGIIVSRDPDFDPAVSLPSGRDYSAAEPLLIVDGTIDAATVSARTAQLDQLQAEHISAKTIVAESISAGTIEGLDARIASLSAGISPTLSDAEVESITDRVKSRIAILTGNVPAAADLPTPAEATTAAILTDPDPNALANLASGSATLASADIDFVTVNSFLAVIGHATMTSLEVTGNLYTDSITAKSDTLALQPLGGTVKLASNTLIVDSSGEVAINGNLTVSGKVLAQSGAFGNLELGHALAASPSSSLGQLLAVYDEHGRAVATIDASGSANLAGVSTKLITIAADSEASSSADIEASAATNATAGESLLVSPATELVIESPYVSASSLVYLTPTTNTDNKVLFVKAKESCAIDYFSCKRSFTVGIDSPARSDISFNWWIIELKD